MMLPSTLQKIFLQHPAKLELNFYQYFPGNLWSCKWFRDPIVQLTPSSFTEQEKENYIDLTCDTVFPKKDCSTQEIRQIYLNFTEW